MFKFMSYSLCFVVLSCTPSGGEDSAPVVEIDRQETLALYADDVIIPAYETFNQKALALDEQAQNFCAVVSEQGFADLKSTWEAAMLAWSATEVHNFGPAMTLRLDSSIYFWPSRPNRIEDFISAGDLSYEAVKSGSSLIKGLSVLEYLIYGYKDNANTFASFEDEGRCTYLQSLAKLLLEDSASLLSAWQPENGNFRDEFALAGNGSASYSRQKQALDAMVNEMIQLTQTVEGVKLARPLGKRSSGTPKPEEVESAYAGISKAIIATNLESLKIAFQGGSEKKIHSLADIIASENNDLWLDLQNELQASELLLKSSEDSLATDVVLKTELTEQTFSQVKGLLNLLASDVASILGVTPTFSDNDGD